MLGLFKVFRGNGEAEFALTAVLRHHGHRNRLLVQRQLHDAADRQSPGRRCFSAHGDDFLALAEPGLLGQGACLEFTHYRPRARLAPHEGQPINQNGKQEIENRTGQHNGGTMTHRLPVEGDRQILRRDFAFALIDHLDVAAQRQGGQGEFRIGRRLLIAPDDLPETQGKSQHLDAEFPGHPEVTIFMHRDQNHQGDDEEEQCMRK